MVDRILHGERCADAAAASILYNLKKKFELREENSIWGPIVMPPRKKSSDTFYGSKLSSKTNDNICSGRSKSFAPSNYGIVCNAQFKEVESSPKSGGSTIVSNSKFSEPTNEGSLKKKDVECGEVKFLKEFKATYDIPEQLANTSMDKFLKESRATYDIPEQLANTSMDEQEKHLGNTCSQEQINLSGILDQDSLEVINNTDGKFAEMNQTLMPVNKLSRENYIKTDASANEMLNSYLDQNPEEKLKSDNFKLEDIELSNCNYSSDNSKEIDGNNTNNQAVGTVEMYSFDSDLKVFEKVKSGGISIDKFELSPSRVTENQNTCEMETNEHITFHKKFSTKRELEGNYSDIEECVAPDIYSEVIEKSNPTLKISDKSKGAITKIFSGNKCNNFQTKILKKNKRVRNRSGDAVNEEVSCNSGMCANSLQLSSQVSDTENQNTIKTKTEGYFSSKKSQNAERDLEGNCYKIHNHPPQDRENELNKQPNSLLKTSDKHKDANQTKNSKFDSSQPEILKKKKNRTRNISGDAVNKKESHSQRKFEKSEDKPVLIVKIADEKTDKCHEIIASYLDISRIQRRYPKLLAILPEVDACKRVNYSADALNMILRYVFNQRSTNSEALPSPVINIEALAAATEYEVLNFQKLLQENILQKILTSANAKLVYAHACNFNLEEISNVSKSLIANDGNLDCQSFRKKEKSSFVSISTYVEPLEIGIPFKPIGQDFSVSFDKTIRNTFTFKAISECYIITGFQVQLNEDYLKNNGGTLKIKIDYCTRNVSNSCVVETKRQEKPLRPINIIYFKKGLVVKPHEVGEINVETDTKPSLCSAHLEKEILVKNKFSLMIDSDFKHSDMKLFIIAKLFYHIKKL